MRQQHALTIELRDHRVGKYAAAAARAETRPEQEVTIAVEREAGDAARAELTQRAAHPLVAGFLVVVPDPCLEEIAEDIERLGRRCLLAQEAQKLLGGLRGGGVEVHVRDEQARHRLTSATGSCSAQPERPGSPAVERPPGRR